MGVVVLGEFEALTHHEGLWRRSGRGRREWREVEGSGKKWRKEKKKNKKMNMRKK